jgi:hypothetical protein
MANRVASDVASGAQRMGVFRMADFVHHDLQLMSERRQIGLSGRWAQPDRTAAMGQ